MVQILEVLQAVLKEWIGFSEETPGESKKKIKLFLFFLLRFTFGLKKLNNIKNPLILFM